MAHSQSVSSARATAARKRARTSNAANSLPVSYLLLILFLFQHDKLIFIGTIQEEDQGYPSRSNTVSASRCLVATLLITNRLTGWLVGDAEATSSSSNGRPIDYLRTTSSSSNGRPINDPLRTTLSSSNGQPIDPPVAITSSGRIFPLSAKPINNNPSTPVSDYRVPLPRWPTNHTGRMLSHKHLFMFYLEMSKLLLCLLSQGLFSGSGTLRMTMRKIFQKLEAGDLSYSY